MELVGIVRCPIHCLCMYGEGRQLSPQVLNRITKRFLRVKCVPHERRNHVRGIITQHDLENILSILGTSRNGLAATTYNSHYPLLSSFRIACLDGRHRLAAASRQRLRKSWVVKLFCVSGEWVDFPIKLRPYTISQQALQDEVESYSHESNYSDGDIYRLVRKYMLKKNKIRETECRTRLSACKEVSLNGLLKQADLRDSIDRLLEYPGTIGGLQLGNIHKDIALHCNEQVTHYLDNRILNTWAFITAKNPDLKRKVDLETVECLQLRIPFASKTDRRHIEGMFDRKEVFSFVENPIIREQLKRRVLSLQVSIPSMETFHENMKYFSIAVKVLRRFVAPDPSKQRPQKTLFQSLSQNWIHPIVPFVETGDGLMQLLEPALTAYIAYKMLVLAVLRNFTHFSSQSPRQDVRGETMPAVASPKWIQYLQQLAFVLGFRSNKIMEGVSNPDHDDDTPTFVPQNGPTADWRGGKPFTKTFLALRSTAYIVNLSDGSPSLQVDCLTPVLMMRDFMNSFFDNTEKYVIDISKPPIDLEAAMNQARNTMLRAGWVMPGHREDASFSVGISGVAVEKRSRSSPQAQSIHENHGLQSQLPRGEGKDTNKGHLDEPSPNITGASHSPSIEGNVSRGAEDETTLLRDAVRSPPQSCDGTYSVGSSREPDSARLVGDKFDSITLTRDDQRSLPRTPQFDDGNMIPVRDAARSPALTDTDLIRQREIRDATPDDTFQRSCTRSPIHSLNELSQQGMERDISLSPQAAASLYGEGATNNGAHQTRLGELSKRLYSREGCGASESFLVTTLPQRTTFDCRSPPIDGLSPNRWEVGSVNEADDTITRRSARSTPSLRGSTVDQQTLAESHPKFATRTDEETLPSRRYRSPPSRKSSVTEDYLVRAGLRRNAAMGVRGRFRRSSPGAAHPVRIPPVRSMRPAVSPIRVSPTRIPPIRSMRTSKWRESNSS
ncbi:hypothetical protein QQS21_002089 [Conoideocrella luteorostrata]|uniref:Uncharacterized protein n=1 Tax=Conoideocrella luteorostrata TaxID=1105319 RepID=A0AAJ0CWM8_9HYPO|nr:hypothetical protein QQS21_002089 [Conoideocrella luteorostrata]